MCGRLAVGEWLMGVQRTLFWWQQADVVGKLDTTNDAFSTIGPLTGVTATMDRFDGAATVGTIVYLAPFVSLPTLASQRAYPRPCSLLRVGRARARAHRTCGSCGSPSVARHSVRRDQVGVWQAAVVCARRDSSQQQAVRVCGRLAVCEWLMCVLRTLCWWQMADVVGKLVV